MGNVDFSSLNDRQKEAVLYNDGPLAVLSTAGSGKCLGKGTPVLMYNGSVKSVEHVKKGDVLMGPDSCPRTVKSTTRGRGPLYEVEPTKGDKWVCNDVHIMTLSEAVGNQQHVLIDVPLNAFLESKPDIQKNGCFRKYRLTKSGEIEFPSQKPFPINFEYVVKRCLEDDVEIPKGYLTTNLTDRKKLLAYIIDTHGQHMEHSFKIERNAYYFLKSIRFLAHSLGFNTNLKRFKKQKREVYRLSLLGDFTSMQSYFQVKQVSMPKRRERSALRVGFKVKKLTDSGEYFGFEISGNDRRFLLGDFTITHNTRCIVNKIEYLVQDQDVMPSRIWACTFTNKAAGEMKERLKKSLGNKAETLKLSTIHSLAYRIYRQVLKEYHPWEDLPKILTHKGSISKHLYKMFKEKKFRHQDAATMLDFIDSLKIRAITPEMYKKQCEENEIGEKILWKNYPNLNWEQTVAVVYEEYERWKTKRGYIDFGDMLVYGLQVLKDPKYKKFIQRLVMRVEYLIIDESQDTNTIAFEIAEILSSYHNKIFLFGDLRQSLYSFQGVDIQDTLNFIRKQQPKIVDLNQNYRSTKKIVNAGNAVIKNSPDIIGEPAFTENEEGEDIRLFGNADLTDESETILEQILELRHQEKEDWRDITILYRVHSQSREIEDQLLINDIPYVSFSKVSFFDRKEIKDLLAYLNICRYPEDATIKDYKRIANRPTRYISNKALDKLEDCADDEDITIYQALERLWDYPDLTNQEMTSLENLLQDLQSLKKFINKRPPEVDNDDLWYRATHEILNYILETMGYKDWAINQKKVSEVDNDIEMNFDSLLNSVKKFDHPDRFLAFLAKVKENEKRKKDENGDYVKLMSCHASKGKEFKNVFIAGVCNRLYPFYRAVDEGKTEEEKRIFYVAMTRAQKRLYISNILDKLGSKLVNLSPFVHLAGLDTKKMEMRGLLSNEIITKFGKTTKEEEIEKLIQGEIDDRNKKENS